MIPVTKPFLPPMEEYKKYVDGIWQRQWLTNMRPLASDLEMRLKQHLGLQHMLFVTNGTVALQMAIKALDLSGEVITTPFSFVATTSSIVWEGCTPVFVDIDESTLNIDPTKIEAAITEKTSAILATHVYGNPCDVEAIEQIAKKHNLKVIYDGAHAFGVALNGKSIFSYGDISTCSLHATKLYHSIEGGLVICKDAELNQKLKYIRNFGIAGFDRFEELGINGKNSEFHAAMGLTNLNYIKKIHHKRKLLSECYTENLKDFGIMPKWHDAASRNYAYFPVVVESEDVLINTKKRLESENIQIRRYFYPSLASALPYLSQKEVMPVTEDIAQRIMCLPMYYDLEIGDINRICNLILNK